MMLRKIPLGLFIEILTDLFENGADFIDLTGDENNEGETPRDSVKITVKPEYLSEEEEEDDDVQYLGQEIRMNFSEDNNKDVSTRPFSDEDIQDLI